MLQWQPRKAGGDLRLGSRRYYRGQVVVRKRRWGIAIRATSCSKCASRRQSQTTAGTYAVLFLWCRQNHQEEVTINRFTQAVS